jgi:hypothetical protein
MAAPVTPRASVPPTMGMRWAADMIYMIARSRGSPKSGFQEIVSWEELFSGDAEVRRAE